MISSYPFIINKYLNLNQYTRLFNNDIENCTIFHHRMHIIAQGNRNRNNNYVEQYYYYNMYCKFYSSQKYYSRSFPSISIAASVSALNMGEQKFTDQPASTAQKNAECVLESTSPAESNIEYTKREFLFRSIGTRSAMLISVFPRYEPDSFQSMRKLIALKSVYSLLLLKQHVIAVQPLKSTHFAYLNNSGTNHNSKSSNYGFALHRCINSVRRLLSINYDSRVYSI